MIHKTINKAFIILFASLTIILSVFAIIVQIHSYNNPQSYYNQNKKQDQYFKQTKYGKYDNLTNREIKILIETDRIQVLKEIRDELRELNKK